MPGPSLLAEECQNPTIFNSNAKGWMHACIIRGSNTSLWISLQRQNARAKFAGWRMPKPNKIQQQCQGLHACMHHQRIKHLRVDQSAITKCQSQVFWLKKNNNNNNNNKKRVLARSSSSCFLPPTAFDDVVHGCQGDFNPILIHDFAWSKDLPATHPHDDAWFKPIFSTISEPF